GLEPSDAVRPASVPRSTPVDAPESPRLFAGNQNFPSDTSKCVGLFKLAPPASTHAATISINSAPETSGGPINAWLADASLNSADFPGSPSKRQGRPNRVAKYSAAARTVNVSGPVMFNIPGGASQYPNDRSAYEFASRCQITLNAGTARPTASPACTLRAMSTST